MINLSLPEGAYGTFTDKLYHDETLYEEESNIAVDYESSRMIDFCRGRFCARQSLHHFGIAAPVLKNMDGAPVWPSGYTGSISHSPKIAGAIVASNHGFQSVGLDIEETGRITEDLWEILFTPCEIDQLKQANAYERPWLSTLMFSAKECFFKAQFQLTRMGLDFPDGEVHYAQKKCQISLKRDLPGLKAAPHLYDISFLTFGDQLITYCLW